MYTIGVFQDLAWAERGIAALLAEKFPPDALSVMARTSPESIALIQSTFGEAPVQLCVAEAGPFAAIGPIVSVLRPSPRGKTGFSAAFGHIGFQRHDGHIYETLLNRGGVLVAVLSEARASDALAVLHAYGGGNAAIGAWLGRV